MYIHASVYFGICMRMCIYIYIYVYIYVHVNYGMLCIHMRMPAKVCKIYTVIRMRTDHQQHPKTCPCWPTHPMSYTPTGQ